MSKALKMIQAALNRNVHTATHSAMRSNEKNAYGLTFRRWLAAAGVKMREDVHHSHLSAWRRGEDPSDYRAGR